MELADESTINKLILLYVFEAMDVPITGNTIIEMCTSRNTWLSYMDCTITINQLIESGFIYQASKEKNSYYNITADGRQCLALFYTRIPSSLRTEITEYVKENRMTMRRKQEYYRNYYKNNDGTYTVQLKIVDPVQTTLEIKLNVANRNTAKMVYNKWEDKAANLRIPARGTNRLKEIILWKATERAAHAAAKSYSSWTTTTCSLRSNSSTVAAATLRAARVLPWAEKSTKSFPFLRGFNAAQARPAPTNSPKLLKNTRKRRLTARKTIIKRA